MYKVLTCLSFEHDWKLVVLAGTVCFLASAVTLSLFQRANVSQGYARLAWMALQAAVSGCGIWATHFIAMLAYDPGIGAGYDVLVTALSLVFAILIAGLGFGLALSAPKRSRAAIGGAIVGLGVAAMHYTGMLALELPARIEWDLPTVFASVVIGSILGGLALVVAVGRESNSRGMLATVLFTLAIVSHHFTAMGAVTLIPDPTLAGDGLNISPFTLSFLVAGAAFVILGVPLVASSMDLRAKQALGRQKVLLDAALENMSQGLCMFDADGRILLFNEHYLQMMGRSDLELEGR